LLKAQISFKRSLEFGRRHLIVNAKHGSEVILDLKTIPTCVRAFDVLGNEAKTICPDRAGLVKLQVPPSGYLEVLTSSL
jgi:hypothetical protein